MQVLKVHDNFHPPERSKKLGVEYLSSSKATDFRS